MTETAKVSSTKSNTIFQVLKSSASSNGLRQGTLSLPGRRVIQTPNYLAISSRGVIPHISPDTLIRDTSINGIYFALEDFIEKAPQNVPPLYNFPATNNGNLLRGFVGLPDDNVTVLGPRRIPPVACAVSNTNTSLSILTSVGHSQLTASDYIQAAKRLRPDIVIGLGDIPYGADTVSKKRAEKVNSRTTNWMTEQSNTNGPYPALFAPIPSLPLEKNWYQKQLATEMASKIQGLAIFNTDSLPTLPVQLSHLPRLSLTQPKTPQHLLAEIGLGTDISTIPFLYQATDAGIALSFRFPAPPPASSPLPLGLDLWDATHATSLLPFTEACTCYACTKHHRAYLTHLLAAKEMLGWVLLQIHNHAIMDSFFAGVRSSIQAETFEQDMEAFGTAYESELPQKTGAGPRVRGYQYKSEGPGEGKRNPKAYGKLDDLTQKKAEAVDSVPRPQDEDAKDLETKGLGTQIH